MRCRQYNAASRSCKIIDLIFYIGDCLIETLDLLLECFGCLRTSGEDYLLHATADDHHENDQNANNVCHHIEE